MRKLYITALIAVATLLTSCKNEPPVKMYNYELQVVYSNNSVDTIRWYARDKAGFRLYNHYNINCITSDFSLGDIACGVKHFKIISEKIAK